jgi:prolyl oligopeptidase
MGLLPALAISACSGASTAPEPVDILSSDGTTLAAPPPTRREDISDELHGTLVADPWRWLEDATSAEVQQWMTDQDVYARVRMSFMGHDRRQQLHDRFTELYYIDVFSAPRRYGDRYVYSRRLADQEKTAFYWRNGLDGEEHVLIDPNSFDPELHVSVESVFVTQDGERFAYSWSINNSDEADLHVVDIDSGEQIDTVTGAKYAWPQWTPDGAGFYYTWLPPVESTTVEARPGLSEIRFHTVGTPQQEDQVIRGASNDPTTFVGPQLSRNGRWLLTSIAFGWASNDLLVRDLQAESPADVPLFEGLEATFNCDFHGDSLFILTNLDAPTYRLMRLELPLTDAPVQQQWVEVVPAQSDAVLQDFSIIGGQLALRYQVNAASRLVLASMDGADVRTVELPSIGTVGAPVGHPDDSDYFFTFQNLVTPPQIMQHSVTGADPTLWQALDVPVDPSQFVVEQRFATSADGTRVPLFVVRPANAEGPLPTLLYGYGGFDVSLFPSFRSSIYPWLEAGGSWALANLRGGGEFGSDWHEAGMLEHKQNVFDDFIAVSEHLVESGLTTPDSLAIHGGSNGGLLVGAAMVQRPDLFGAVICAVPLLDMVRFHRFGSGQTWTREYGNPDQAADFEWLYAYSPYHHVTAGTAYPPLLMMSADSDDRVDPMHARKFVAAVQAASPTPEHTLLRIERNAGHGGADLVSQAVESSVDLYSFLFATIGSGLTAR